MSKCKCGKEVKGTYKTCFDCFTKNMDKCPTCGKNKPKEYDLCFTCNQKKINEDAAEFEISKFASRFANACVSACKNCRNVNLNPDLAKAFDLEDYEDRTKTVIFERSHCPEYKIWERPEINTTYPGQTNAPSDNSNPDLEPDSTDINYDYKAPKRCLGYDEGYKISETSTINNWELCLKLIFDRKRCDWDKNPTFNEQFPSPSEVLRLLNTSFIPQFTFRLGLPPQKGMGFDRGLWFYRSEKFNSQLVATEDMKPDAIKMAKKNSAIKAEMKKLMMVYLYHCWFKKLDNEKKEGYYMALDSSDKFSLGKDLSWWMLSVFKDETALTLYPTEEENEIEFIPISLLDKAQQAAMLAAEDCNSMTEIDLEAEEYDNMIRRLGYDVDEGIITDKDGHEITDSWNTLKPIF